MSRTMAIRATHFERFIFWIMLEQVCLTQWIRICVLL